MIQSVKDITSNTYGGIRSVLRDRVNRSMGYQINTPNSTVEHDGNPIVGFVMERDTGELYLMIGESMVTLVDVGIPVCLEYLVFLESITSKGDQLELFNTSVLDHTIALSQEFAILKPDKQKILQNDMVSLRKHINELNLYDVR